MMVGGKEDGLPETTMCNETKTFRLFKKDNYFLGVSQRKKEKNCFWVGKYYAFDILFV